MNMKKNLSIIMACASSAIILFSCTKEEEGDGSQLNQMDQQFVLMAAISNTAEVDAGMLAMDEDKSDSADIMDFGEMMVTDHTAAQSQLKSIASATGLNAPDSLDAEHQALKQALMAASGREFDSLYIH